MIVVSNFLHNDLDNYSLLNHTHDTYVTSDQVSTIVSESIESGEITVSGSLIRKITRGTASANGDTTISCSITDTNKVVVILNMDGNYVFGYKETSYNSYFGFGSPGIYLKSVSATGIVVTGYGYSYSSYLNNVNTTPITFSYQIIEFM